MNKTTSGPGDTPAEGKGVRRARTRHSEYATTGTTGTTGATGTTRAAGNAPANPSQAPAIGTPSAPFESILEDNILVDVRNPQAVVPLWGYLVESPPDYYLFLNLEFNEYLVISGAKDQPEEAAYVYHQPLSSDVYPLAGTIVWVRAGAELRHVRIATTATTVPATQAANMLRGTIQQQAMQGPGQMSPLPLPGSGRGAVPGGDPGSYGGCGTGNNTPGCPYGPSYNC